MGSTVCRAVEGAGDMELVATVDPAGGSGSLEALSEGRAEVAVDFTVAAAAVENALWCAANGIHCVIGTTGISAADLDRLLVAFPAGGSGDGASNGGSGGGGSGGGGSGGGGSRLGCVVAPNFAIGAVLMMHFAALAAPWFETAEIIELHHDRKVDAPSGTALLTARRMTEASESWGEDPTKDEVVAGARGGLASPGGIRIHSVRLRGLVAHQEVILGTAGQTLTIRHDSLDRESFMPGVLLAVREVAARPGVTVGLESLLGIL